MRPTVIDSAYAKVVTEDDSVFFLGVHTDRRSTAGSHRDVRWPLKFVAEVRVLDGHKVWAAAYRRSGPRTGWPGASC